MTRTGVATALALAVGTSVSLSSAQTDVILARARTAIGIGTTGPVVKSLTLAGVQWTSQTVVSDAKTNQKRSEDQEHPFELRVAAPNRFARVEVNIAFAMTAGFNGSVGISRSEGLRPGATTSGGELSGNALASRQVEVWQIVAGVAAISLDFTGFRTTETSRHTLQVTGPNNFRARLELDPETGRPAKIVRRTRFTVIPPRTILGPAGSIGSGRIPDSLPEDDLTMTFSDRRQVNGLSLASRVTVSGKGVDMTEYRFSEIIVNPTFTAKDFE